MSDGMRPLKILLVEDSKNDALLLQRHLIKGGIVCELTHVETLPALREALNRGGWDLLLTDFVLPTFDGLAVVKSAQTADPNLPCIIISGQVGEEYAVEALRGGARDFINKNNLTRLLPAIHREMQSEEERRTALQMEVRFQESEARFRAISEVAQDGIIMMNPEGQVSFWNRSAERIFGYTSAEIMSKNVHQTLAPPAKQEAFQRAFARFIEFGEVDVVGHTTELPAITKDGREIHIELSLSRAHFESGWFGIGIARDVTERIASQAERAQMEIQLRHAQKLESIGQLAAGIAHEINTPIQYIGDNTIFLRDACHELLGFLDDLRPAFAVGPFPESELESLKGRLEALDLDYLQKEIPRAILQSLDGVARVAKIVSAMKDFSHPSMGVKGMADLNRAIENTVTVCRNEWKYVAELELDLDPSLPLVPCFADEFNQVVLNLVINAAHAIEEAAGGRAPEAKGLIRISTRLRGERVEIRVSDTGTGIPENIRDRIFDPFFTTKALSKGTGQGLAIARSVIVDKHQGSIQVETEAGKGTTFILELPMSGNGNGSQP
jgi:two-component system, NtrC family, sensor kinase